MSNIPAQIAYAQALDLAYGSHRAENHFNELMSRFPLVIEYPQAYGEYYFNKGLYDLALSQFQGIVEKDSQFKPAYIYLGRIHALYVS